jgi:hypothetical protein
VRRSHPIYRALSAALLLLAPALLLPGFTAAQAAPTIPVADRIRIAELYRLADQIQDKIWPGWSKAPFAILLITPEHEFLIRHPEPTKDFADAGYDELLKSRIFYRKRQFDPAFLATFAAVGTIPTIVVGEAEKTMSKTSSPWVIALLHEHFHQLEYSDAHYNAAVDALNLSGGDKTGMWMLNFPFPYGKEEVQKAFHAMCTALSDAVGAPDGPPLPEKLAAYRKAREDFKKLLSESDYRYLSFQNWQEGVARYTELRVAERAAAEYTPTPEFQKLPDYTPFSQVADYWRKNILAELPGLPLGNYKCVVFYYLGAAEAMLLDRVNPAWKEKFFEQKFLFEDYY